MMILCFWLVIIFLDGTFSYHHLSSSSTTALPSPTSFKELTGTSLTTSSVDSVATMVSGVVHQSLGNSDIFQDLSVLEYLYTKNKNPELLQPLVEKFLQYYQFDKANQYLTLLVQEEGDYTKLKIDPRQVIYTRLHDSTIGLDTANSLDSIFTLIKDYASRDMLTQDDLYLYN
ncbi:MAG: hypothetical protein WCL02_03100 [bacterium]